MNMRKKLGIVLVIGLILIFLMTMSVLGYSYTTNLVPDKTSVAKGDTVVVTIKLSGIDAGNGLFNFSAVLNYDTEVFEEVTQGSIAATQNSGWTVTYEPSTKKMLLENASLVNSDSDIATITLRVKADAAATSASIGLTEIKASNEAEEIAGTDISTTIQISNTAGGGTGGGNLVTNTPSNEPTGNTLTPGTNEPANGNFINEVENMIGTNDTSDEDVPYTGSENYVLPLIVIAIVLGVISFVNYKKLDSTK